MGESHWARERWHVDDRNGRGENGCRGVVRRCQYLTGWLGLKSTESAHV